MQTYLNNRKPPAEVAVRVLKARYPQALFAFVAGSFQRGEATLTSDIDLVVIFEKLEHAWRESFVFDEWPVEAFVHDPETLAYFFYEVDGKSGIPSLPSMVAEGEVIPSPQALSHELKRQAANLLSGPAPKWSEETIYNERFAITDLIDDLRAPRNGFEAQVIIGTLHETLGNFYFRSQGYWSASRKHIPRRMLKHDLEMGRRWVEVFEAAYQGQHAQLVQLAEEMLKPFGGFLFEGYKREAPKEWRLPSQR